VHPRHGSKKYETRLSLSTCVGDEGKRKEIKMVTNFYISHMFLAVGFQQLLAHSDISSTLSIIQTFMLIDGKVYILQGVENHMFQQERQVVLNTGLHDRVCM
jgi:hypothetical protein